MTKAKELIKWFKKNGKPDTERWEIEEALDWFGSDAYMSDTYEIYDQGRWSTHQSAVWKFDDESYAEISWATGSTECQEIDPNIKIVEVEPYETTLIKYRKVK